MATAVLIRRPASGCCQQCRDLREQVTLLEERNRQLTATLYGDTGWTPRPEAVKLSKSHIKIVRVLLREGLISADRILSVLYSMDNEPEWSVTRVRQVMCELRKQLRPHGVTIDNTRGLGYHITAREQEILRGLGR